MCSALHFALNFIHGSVEEGSRSVFQTKSTTEPAMFAINELIISQKVLLAGKNVCAYLPNSCKTNFPITAVSVSKYLDQQQRCFSNKHYDPRWRRFRALKVVPVELPDFEGLGQANDLTPDEIRAKMKERGMFPPRPWMERPYEISSTADIFEPYVPPEGEGKASYISKEGAKQTAEIVQKKSKTWMAFRKIRQYDEDFVGPQFAKEAQQIYLDVHKAVAEKDKNTLREKVTEKAYPEVTHNMRYRTIHWNFLHSIEPAKVVYARCTDVISKENVFAQVTCRFFTKQTLAIYDRFGRLAHGSEVIAKDVLEYVVFEKHIANQYGMWRIHGKIIPDWAPTNFETSFRTFKMSSEA